MIGWLHGVVVERSREGLILEVGGVGYEVVLPANLVSSGGRPGEKLVLWIHPHATSESPAATLFGFGSSEQRQVFRSLLKVKGIGPKLAQLIIAQLGAKGVIETVRNEDLGRLRTVPGVGKKTAQQVILDLSGQITSFEIEDKTQEFQGHLAAVTSALINLGFTRGQVEKAFKSLKDKEKNHGTFDEVLRRALALLREI